MVREVQMSWDSDCPRPNELARSNWDLDDFAHLESDGLDAFAKENRKKARKRKTGKSTRSESSGND
ncbi:hypothetical protein [Thalassoglobus polymorphus]|uniref:Uncharacterized protein n=1 Tax=Thalassoglobus polymorphus TaxID=2527994 RepID=A0A517QKI2_9PLAN|nr:hypothetical protein [Thalassoglobus polymorphus]QDT32159.1 hypothetical protein Mal48_14010 [Thalassoglobus polymorphus]